MERPEESERERERETGEGRRETMICIASVTLSVPRFGHRTKQREIFLSRHTHARTRRLSLSTLFPLTTTDLRGTKTDQDAEMLFLLLLSLRPVQMDSRSISLGCFIHGWLRREHQRRGVTLARTTDRLHSIDSETLMHRVDRFRLRQTVSRVDCHLLKTTNGESPPPDHERRKNDNGDAEKGHRGDIDDEVVGTSRRLSHVSQFLNGKDDSCDGQRNGVHDEVDSGTEETPGERNGQLRNAALIVFPSELADGLHRGTQSNAREIEGEQNENLVEAIVESRSTVEKEKENGRGVEDTIADRTKQNVFDTATRRLGEDEDLVVRRTRIVFQEDMNGVKKKFQGEREKDNEKNVGGMVEKKEVGEEFADFDGDRTDRLNVKIGTDRRQIGQKANDHQNEEEHALFMMIATRLLSHDGIDNQLLN